MSDKKSPGSGASNDDTLADQLSAFDAFGEAFEKDEDRLKEFNETFQKLEDDPSELYIEYRIRAENITEGRMRHKKMVIDRWVDHMSDYNRHHACANSMHVSNYIDSELEKGNSGGYIKSQLNIIGNMFDYWSDHPKMPHGTEGAKGYNPINTAYKFKKEEIIGSNEANPNPPHPISLEELAHILRQIKNLLYRVVIMTQFKYGLRSGQLCNIHISDLKLNNDEVSSLYPELGTHHRINDFDDDVIYFAPTYERRGGKSKRPIVMPVGAELKRLLVKYLRQRPPVDEPTLFINNSNSKRLRPDYVNREIWKPAFHPEYSETDKYRSVTSHFARHWFVTYWRKDVGINKELLKYMRGDKQDNLDPEREDVLDHYVYTYYNNIKERYINNIYRFG